MIDKISLIGIVFLLIVRSLPAQELESNTIFREVYSCHFKVTGDILLFRKNEIARVQFIPGNDSIQKRIVITTSSFDQQSGIYHEVLTNSYTDSTLYAEIVDSLRKAGFAEPTMEVAIETNKEGVTSYKLESGTRILLNREKPIDGRYYLMFKRKNKKEVIGLKVETPCYYFAEFYQHKPNEVMMILSASYCEDNIYKICYLFRD